MTPINISQPVLDKLGKLFNVKDASHDGVFQAMAGMSDLRLGVKDSGEGPLEILMDGVIGDPWDEMDSFSVSRKLMENRDRDVRLIVNSVGGLVFDGMGIYGSLAAHNGKTEGVVRGLAASAATIALCGCDKIVMEGQSTWMIHNSIGVAVGHKSAAKELHDILDAIDSQIASIYAARTGLDIEDVLNLMEGEHGDGTWYKADDALDAGFVDEVLPLKGKPKGKAKAEQTDSTVPGDPGKTLVAEDDPPHPGPAEYRDIAAEGLKRVRAAMGLKV